MRVWWIGIPLGVAFLDRSLRDGAVDALVVVGRSLGVTLVVMILAMPIFVLATRSDPLTTRDGAWIVGSFFAWYVATWLAGWLPALAYNWDGLITATAVVSILIAARSDLPLAEMGISLPSHPGWFWPTVAMAGAAVAYALVLDPGGTTLTGEGWASNLTLPGLSEELLFRGLLLGILDNRLGQPWRLWGTNVGWGLIITTALFGLAHAVQPFQGVSFEAGQLLVVPIGFALGWIRERSGSILPAIVAHNLVNTLGVIV